MRKIFMAMLLSISALASSPAMSQAAAAADQEAPAQADLVSEGIELIKSSRPGDAIERFDRVIAWYERAYAGETRKIYCAGSPSESVAYLVLGAAYEKKDAITLDQTWAHAIFFKGYALIDLGRREDARPLFRRALELSPRNSQYLSEYAELKKGDRDWQESYDLFEEAHGAASLMPEEKQGFWQARALRGMGFTLIELGDLDKAETMFRKSLELDPNNQGARSELQYIEDVRKQQPKANAGPPSRS